jgi:hypothetical protein
MSAPAPANNSTTASSPRNPAAAPPPRLLGARACVQACERQGISVPVEGALAEQVAIHLMTLPASYLRPAAD